MSAEDPLLVALREAARRVDAGEAVVLGDVTTRREGLPDLPSQVVARLSNGTVIAGWISPDRNPAMVVLTRALFDVISREGGL